MNVRWARCSLESFRPRDALRMPASPTLVSLYASSPSNHVSTLVVTFSPIGTRLAPRCASTLRPVIHAIAHYRRRRPQRLHVARAVHSPSLVGPQFGNLSPFRKGFTVCRVIQDTFVRFLSPCALDHMLSISRFPILP
jgi:hypothetical protein